MCGFDIHSYRGDTSFCQLPTGSNLQRPNADLLRVGFVEPIAMSDASKKLRAVADPAITVSQLQEVLQDTISDIGSRGLKKYIEEVGDQHQWRPSPKPTCTLAYAICKRLAVTCKNGVCPTKKLELAITAEHLVKAILFDNKGKSLEEQAFVLGGNCVFVYCALCDQSLCGQLLDLYMVIFRGGEGGIEVV